MLLKMISRGAGLSGGINVFASVIMLAGALDLGAADVEHVINGTHEELGKQSGKLIFTPYTDDVEYGDHKKKAKFGPVDDDYTQYPGGHNDEKVCNEEMRRLIVRGDRGQGSTVNTDAKMRAESVFDNIFVYPPNLKGECGEHSGVVFGDGDGKTVTLDQAFSVLPAGSQLCLTGDPRAELLGSRVSIGDLFNNESLSPGKAGLFFDYGVLSLDDYREYVTKHGSAYDRVLFGVHSGWAKTKSAGHKIVTGVEDGHLFDKATASVKTTASKVFRDLVPVKAEDAAEGVTRALLFSAFVGGIYMISKLFSVFSPSAPDVSNGADGRAKKGADVAHAGVSHKKECSQAEKNSEGDKQPRAARAEDGLDKQRVVVKVEHADVWSSPVRVLSDFGRFIGNAVGSLFFVVDAIEREYMERNSVIIIDNYGSRRRYYRYSDWW